MCANMPQYITAIEVSLSQAEEQDLQANHYEKINVNLNKGGCGNPVFLWYKTESSATPITRIQVSFEKAMFDTLTQARYTKVENSPIPGRKPAVYLWYFCGDTNYHTPIEKLDVSTDSDTEADKIKFNWERVGCNLNGVGNWVYLWVKRAQQTYICDVTATDSFGSDVDLFSKGYIRIDETTNNCGCGTGTGNFIWYRQTKDVQHSLTDLQISTNTSEYQQYQQQGYTSVSVNLNEGTNGRVVYLWYKKEKGKPQVKSMLLLLCRDAMKPYEKAGIHVIDKNINEGNDGPDRYLCVFKSH